MEKRRSTPHSLFYSDPTQTIPSPSNTWLSAPNLPDHPTELHTHYLSPLDQFNIQINPPLYFSLQNPHQSGIFSSQSSVLIQKKRQNSAQNENRILAGRRNVIIFKSQKTDKIEYGCMRNHHIQGLHIEQMYKGKSSIVWKIKPSDYEGFIVKKKVLHLGRSKSREAQVLSQLSGHSFIVSLFDAFKVSQQDGSSLQLFMEYYPDGDLQRKIYLEGTLDLSKVKIFAYQLFRGLHSIHNKKICHRDIKASNIFLRGNHLSIGDFGSAKILRQGQQNSLFIFGPERAPELVLENKNYDLKIDIWAVGCVIVEMVLGKKLFNAWGQQADLLVEIFKVRGYPTASEFAVLNPNFASILENWKLPGGLQPKPWSTTLEESDLDGNLSNLLDLLFKFDFTQRISALEALAHPYFDEIRVEQKYRMLKQKYDLEEDFFRFAENELPREYSFLVPEWAKSRL